MSLAAVGNHLKSRYLVSLQFLEYRKLWGGSFCSQSSAWALIVARMALVLQITGSPAWTGAVTFAAMTPSVLVTPVAGYLADRFDRRRVLLASYSINLVLNLLLALLVVTGAVNEWYLLVHAVINGSARSVQMPAAQALLPNTLPKEHLFNAMSLYGATQHGSRFVGPFLILVVLWLTGRQDWVFFLCTALYALGLVFIFRIRTASTGVTNSGTGLGAIYANLGQGLKYMYRNPLVMSLVLLVVAHCGMTMSFESLLPVLSRDKLGLDTGAKILGGASYLMVGYGAAALVTALALAGVRSESVRGRLFLWMAVFSALTPVALAMSPNLPLAMLSAASMGVSQGGFMVISGAMLQATAPDAIRGRVMGVYNWHILGFMASFNLINGTLAELTSFTAPLILGAGGLAFLVVVTLSLGRIPLRQLYARGVPAT